MVKTILKNLLRNYGSPETKGGIYIHVLGLKNGEVEKALSEGAAVYNRAEVDVKMQTKNMFFFQETIPSNFTQSKLLRYSVDEKSLVKRLKEIKDSGDTFADFDDIIREIKYRSYDGKEVSASEIGHGSVSNSTRTKLIRIVADYACEKIFDILFGMELSPATISQSNKSNTLRSPDLLEVLCKAVELSGGNPEAVKEIFLVRDGNLVPPTLEKQVSAINPIEVTNELGEIEIHPPIISEEHLILCNLLFSSKYAYRGKVKNLLFQPAMFDDIFYIRAREKSHIFDTAFNGSLDREIFQVGTGRYRDAVDEQIARSSFNANYVAKKFSLEFRR